MIYFQILGGSGGGYVTEDYVQERINELLVALGHRSSGFTSSSRNEGGGGSGLSQEVRFFMI